MQQLHTALLALMASAVCALSQVELLPGEADSRDDCWILRSYPGQTMTTYGIRGTGGELSGYVTWSSFSGPSGVYKAELGAVLESDGNSPYKLFIDGDMVREGEYPYADGSLECDGSTYRETYLDLGNWRIDTGDEIKYWAMSVYPCGSSHGQYSRFFMMRLTPTNEPADDIPTQPDTNVDRLFVEKERMVVIEAEHTGSSLGQWVEHTNTGTYSSIDGFHGDGVLRFTGNTESGGAPKSVLSYYIKINTPNRYRLRMRVMEAEGSDRDKANDCYVACPSQDTTYSGQSGCEGSLTKWVAWRSGNGEWTWDNKLECGHHTFSDAEYIFPEPGIYELQIAGRSKNFFVDRIVLALPGNAACTSSTHAESEIIYDPSTTGTVRPAARYMVPAEAAPAPARTVGGAVYGLDGRRVGIVGADGRIVGQARSLAHGVLLVPEAHGMSATVRGR